MEREGRERGIRGRENGKGERGEREREEGERGEGEREERESERRGRERGGVTGLWRGTFVTEVAPFVLARMRAGVSS